MPVIPFLNQHFSPRRLLQGVAPAAVAVAISCGGADTAAAPDTTEAPEAAAAPAVADIATYAGTGSPRFEGDGGPAAQAGILSPNGLALDREGNLFISADNRIRRVDGATGVITTVAGAGSVLKLGDNGPATDADLLEPRGLALDAAGNLYIAEFSNNRIRRVDAATGIITTVAGGGIGDPRTGQIGDGLPATEALVKEPRDVAVDGHGNVYTVAANRLRRVDGGTGIITTLTGNGLRDLSGDGGPAAEAQIAKPEGVTVDPQGNIYIADSDNQRIRRIDAATGIITTVAGIGKRAPWSHPEYPIRPEGMGYSGDGGPATSAMLATPTSVIVGPQGYVYIADTGNDRIRWLDMTTGIITTAVDGGAASTSTGGKVITTFTHFSPPSSVVINGERVLFITDPQQNRILKIPLP